jgi:hypothetical protein
VGNLTACGWSIGVPSNADHDELAETFETHWTMDHLA